MFSSSFKALTAALVVGSSVTSTIASPLQRLGFDLTNTTVLTERDTADWSLTVYHDGGCSESGGYLNFKPSGENGLACTNINTEIDSYLFYTSGGWQANLYQDSNCGGQVDYVNSGYDGGNGMCYGALFGSGNQYVLSVEVVSK